MIQEISKVIHFMALMKEVSFIFGINLPKIEVFCKVFEYKQSCIAVAESKKCSLKTKHIAIKYHHFLIFVKKIVYVILIQENKQWTFLLSH